MRQILLLICVSFCGLGCSRSEPGKEKIRPDEKITARITHPEHFEHGKRGSLAVSYFVARAGQELMINAEDLPPQFNPEILITFERDGQLTGEPVTIHYDPDC